MELEIDVKITPNVLYDYMMYHTYSKMSGILSGIVGAFMVAVFFMGYSPIYLICGIIVLAYLPYTFFIRSRKQYLNNPAFKEMLHYHFSDDGITVSQGDVEDTILWESVVKAVSTPASILVYTSPINASIFPKKDLADKKYLLIQMISTHVSPKKVKIRG